MIEFLTSIHPFVVHFAVAYTLATAFFDILDFLFRKKYFETAAFIISMLALPFLLTAVLTGNLAGESLNKPEALILLQQHETAANIAMWLFTASFVWRIFMVLKKQFTGWRKMIYLCVLSAAAISIFLAAQKGGKIFHGGAGEHSAYIGK